MRFPQRRAVGGREDSDSLRAGRPGEAQGRSEDANQCVFRSGDFSLAGSTSIHSEPVGLVKHRVAARTRIEGFRSGELSVAGRTRIHSEPVGLVKHRVAARTPFNASSERRPFVGRIDEDSLRVDPLGEAQGRSEDAKR